MIDCPSCQRPVEVTEKHHGTLFTCPHCNSVYFIGWDGHPEMAQHEPDPQTQSGFVPPISEFSSEQNFQQPQDGFAPPEQNFGGEAYQENSGFQNEQQNYGTESVEPAYQNTEYSEDQNYGAQESYVAEPAETNEPSMAQDAYSATEPTEQETPYDFSQTLDHHPDAVPVLQATPDTADFSDVASFANADASAGPLAYTVIIEGIESSLLLNQLRDAMTDSRFSWDVNKLLTQVGGGRLTLTKMSPAKASVLINRIKYMPLKISWRQDVFSGS
ncbi:hypothetical protein D3C87_111020 [compost metagenome]